MARALILDAEIKKAIPKLNEEDIEWIEYCAGWGDFPGMGISVLCGYDTEGDDYLFWDDENKDDLNNLLNEVDLVVGFNSLDFDSKLIKTCWDIDINSKPHFDLRKVINKASGSRKGTLDTFASLNLGIGKNGNGALAPLLYQRQKFAKLYTYNLRDVKLTRDLFLKIERGEGIVCNEKGGIVYLKDELDRIMS